LRGVKAGLVSIQHSLGDILQWARPQLTLGWFGGAN